MYINDNMNRVKTDVPDPGSASATHTERTRVGDMADADTKVTELTKEMQRQ